MPASSTPSAQSLHELAATVRPGDVVFIRIPFLPFTAVATATGSWTNHVGIVVDRDESGPVIAESRVPLSQLTSFAAFVRRSQQGRVAILRLPRSLTADECARLRQAAHARLGRLYDAGFNLDSRRQFCSRFVREVIAEACGESVGQIDTLAELLGQRPGTDLTLWKLWYFGRIPWQRRTVTPASLYTDPTLRTAFDGTLNDQRRNRSPARLKH